MTNTYYNHETSDLSLSTDAKIVAIRWDLIEWSLVIDLDALADPKAPTNDIKSRSFFRVWIVFLNISEISWPLSDSRIPTGCWLDGAFDIYSNPLPLDNTYTARVFAPVFCENKIVPGRARISLSVCAQSHAMIVSSTHILGNEHRNTNYVDRQLAAPDCDMLDTYRAHTQ